MATPMDRRTLSVEEYLEGERHAEVRHEYVAGQVYVMVGASDRHNLIALNLATALRPRARGTPCQLFMSDMKLRLNVAGDEVFYYPDLLLACDPGDRATYYRAHPCLIVEVLSEATARVDRREKLFAYTAIESLRSYILLSQDAREAQVHRRTENWRARRITEGALPIDCLDTEVSLATVYEDVPGL